jgi:hypothetical protein
VKKRDLVPGDPYYDAWHEYGRVWRRSLVLFAVSFWGGSALTAGLVGVFFPAAPVWITPVLILPWVAAAAMAGQAPIRWRCPRCARPFFSTTWFRNGFARRCLHCGLPKWAPRDPDA